MNNLISVVCTCYNHAEFVKETIESIWEQDYKNIEIIVVDDGSKDNSPQVLIELAKQSPLPMEVILQENTGKIGLNFNRGIAKAKGEFIMFTSCDDKFAPNILSKLVDKIKEDESKQFVFCVRSRKFGIKDGKSFEEENHNPFSLEKKYTVQDLLDGELHQAGLFWVQNTLFRRCIVDKVGGFDEDLLGDDIVLRIKVLQHLQKTPNLTFDFINEVGFYYRIHENNIHKNSERQCRIIYEVNKRYFPNEKSTILPKWVSGACKNYLKKGEYKKAFKLFFSKMNTKKLYYFTKFIIIPQFPKFKIIKNFIRLERALNKYYKENGSFPICENWSNTARFLDVKEDWIPNLAPKYIKKLPKGEYLYRSDGKGYKVILHTNIKINKYKCKSGVRDDHNVLAISNKEGDKF